LLLFEFETADGKTFTLPVLVATKDINKTYFHYKIHLRELLTTNRKLSRSNPYLLILAKKILKILLVLEA
jgi:hypothetical protein